MDERLCEKLGIGPGGDWCPEKLQVCVNVDVMVDIPIERGNLAQNIESEATAFVKESLVNSLMTGPRGEGFPVPAVRSLFIHSSDVTDDRFKKYYDPNHENESEEDDE